MTTSDNLIRPHSILLKANDGKLPTLQMTCYPVTKDITNYFYDF